MNIYAETNFVQELTFLQEQFQSCEQILVLCEQKKTSLIIPAYCLVEPLEKLHRQKLKRQEIQREINNEKNHLSRTKTYNSQIQNIEKLDILLTQSVEEERKRFENYRSRILSIAAIVTLDLQILSEAEKFELIYNLSFQDAIVLASVLSHLKLNSTTQSCFLNRNSKDFDIPQIRVELENLNCKMIPRFDDGYNFILKQFPV